MYLRLSSPLVPKRTILTDGTFVSSLNRSLYFAMSISFNKEHTKKYALNQVSYKEESILETKESQLNHSLPTFF